MEFVTYILKLLSTMRARRSTEKDAVPSTALLDI
jgi:hypothetical protein